MNSVDSEVLEYVKGYQEENPLAPRLGQIRQACKLTSAGVCYSLARLVRYGLVKMENDNINGLQIIAVEKVVVMGQHWFTDLRWEQLDKMINDPEYGAIEVVKEGFPEMTPWRFVEMFCKANKCEPGILVHRMEFEYLITEDK